MDKFLRAAYWYCEFRMRHIHWFLLYYVIMLALGVSEIMDGSIKGLGSVILNLIDLSFTALYYLETRGGNDDAD